MSAEESEQRQKVLQIDVTLRKMAYLSTVGLNNGLKDIEQVHKTERNEENNTITFDKCQFWLFSGQISVNGTEFDQFLAKKESRTLETTSI